MSVWKKLSFSATVCGLFCVYTVWTLLHVLLVLIRNPRKALRKIPRESKRVSDPFLQPSLDHRYVLIERPPRTS